jgi:RNA polymerase sigma factor (sigma-70 family)
MFREKTFKARPRLNICRAWLRWRCGYDKGTQDEHTSMEPDGTGGTTTVGAIWRNGNGTVALPQAHGSALRRYARASVEVGRLPSLLGREFFRSRVTSYTMRNFEDVVIFVADMEQAIEKLNAIEKKLLAMNVLEEYTIPEVARLLGCTQRTVERFLQDALDQLSRILLAGGLMEKLPSVTGGAKTCQEGKNYNFDLSDSNEGENKYRKVGGTPPSDLIS